MRCARSRSLSHLAANPCLGHRPALFVADDSANGSRDLLGRGRSFLLGKLGLWFQHRRCDFRRDKVRIRIAGMHRPRGSACDQNRSKEYHRGRDFQFAHDDGPRHFLGQARWSAALAPAIAAPLPWVNCIASLTVASAQAGGAGQDCRREVAVVDEGR